MVLDIALIVIILLGVFIGYKRGFVKVVIKLGTMILAIVLAFVLQNSVAEFIGEELGLKNTISVAVENKLGEFADGKGDKKELNIPILEKTIEDISKAKDNEKQEAISNWTTKIADFVVKGLSFILIFLVVSITMGIIGLILNTITELPVLKTLNGVLGASTEFVLMLFRIFIVLAIISFLSPLEILTTITNYIDESCITKWLYENNIIVSIIGRKLL